MGLFIQERSARIMDKEYKTVTVQFTIDLPMKFPADFTNHDIEFFVNESSWCHSNIIELLEQYDEEHGCLCHICRGKVL